MIPDSLYGAVLLSVIDFVLSFVVISFIGFVLALFPHLNRTGKALQATPVGVSIMPARDERAQHAVVIAAAIYAMFGARRIVHIGEARPGAGLDCRIPCAFVCITCSSRSPPVRAFGCSAASDE